MAQAQQVADQIQALTGVRVSLVGITSAGDTNPGDLATIGGAGVFVAAVRDAVVRGEADLAVHSMKDLPTEPLHDLELLAVPQRAPAADVLVAADNAQLVKLAAGALVGTGSPRRRAQLLRNRPDLDVVAIRGNVDSRLAMVARGELAAIVIAHAGLDRLGLTHHISEVLDSKRFLPAPGQGALALEGPSAGGSPYRDAIASINHPDSWAAVTAERSALASLEAGCSAPVAAYADCVDDQLILTVAVFDLEGREEISTTISGASADAELLGHNAAGELLARGANRLLGERVP